MPRGARLLALIILATASCGGGPVASRPAPPAARSGAPTTASATTASRAATSRAPTTAPPPCRSAPVPASYDHVIWIWMENHSGSSVLGDTSATFERSLATQCGVALDDHSVGSPSLPNYIGATSGDTWGIGDDAGPVSHPLRVDNLFRQVRVSGRTERSYEESMPGPCTPSSAGRYAVRHNPAAYYVGGGDRAACAADDVPLGTPASGALATAIDGGGLPAFAFITPDLCNDTHDCEVRQGDQWLAQWVPRILAGPDYRAGRTAVFIAWDEPSPMAVIVVAPSVAPGTRVRAATDHYGLLRTTEDMLALPLLGRARGATSLRAMFAV